MNAQVFYINKDRQTDKQIDRQRQTDIWNIENFRLGFKHFISVSDNSGENSDKVYLLF